MKEIKTSIIPVKQTFVKIKETPHQLDYKAICIYSALGFFLDTDTFWLDKKVLPPATINTIDNDGFWISSKKWFQWSYKPKEDSLKEVVTNFTNLFHKILNEQVKDNKVILPLSGGLDSRTQAVGLKYLKKTVTSYSYSFENGFNESGISKKIASKADFKFTDFTIKKGYLWNVINKLASINNCYSEFTHPRQMGVYKELKNLNGEVFSLGHWGDVLFDSDSYPEELSDNEITSILLKKIVKKGGIELAKSLWKNWQLEGQFEDYLNLRILQLVKDINIKNTNAKIRAFKSLYWAPRWTSVNLSIFENIAPITLPYYDDRMCEFICSVPEKYLINRQIQIEYIKNTNKEIASIVWQDKRPFNLFNYHLHKFPFNFPYRVKSKLQREFSKLKNKKFIQRNWELQFLGENNSAKLDDHLNELTYNSDIPMDIITNFTSKFKKESVYYSHSISMLLTLSSFFKNKKI